MTGGEPLRDNPHNYWFKRKLYGWGWIPAKIEGWIVVFIFIVFIAINAVNLASKADPTNTGITLFLTRIVIAIIILIFICYKTGEKPRWSWGK